MARKFSELAAPILADPVRRAEIERQKRAIDVVQRLADLRESRSITQREVAEEMHVSQPNISRIEHQGDLYLSTLSEYVEALGGRLDLTAVFPDESISFVLCKEHDPETASND